MRSFGGAAALVLALAQQVAGHAFMSQPASRMAHAHWATPRTEFEPQSAGGPGGRAPCGKIQGHDYIDDAWNSGHAGTHQKIVKGGVLQTEVTVTAHHWGHFEFSVCDLDTIGPFEGTAAEQKVKKDAAIWDCFNHKSNLLERSRDYEVYDPAPIDNAHPTRWYLPPRDVTSWPPQGWTGAPTVNDKTVYRMWLKVPTTVNCDGDNCILFYFYYSTNSCEGAGYREFMVGQAPAQVKNYFNDRADKRWTCAACGSCTGKGAEDGAIHDGMRKFNDMGSLGAPERFYGCSDVSTTTGHVLTLPPPSSAPWCAEQVCDGSATHAPTLAPVTAAPQQTAATTASPTQNAADCQCTQAKSWCQAKCVARSNGVSMNQCWGTPTTFLQCRCSDGTDLTAQSVAESGSACQCLHSTCPATGTAAPQQTTAQPTTATPASQAPSTGAPLQQGATTAAPSTAAPTAAATQGGSCSSWCSLRAHDAAIAPCGTCSPSFCHGVHVMNCPAGLVFSHTLSVCNWPSAETQNGQSCSA